MNEKIKIEDKFLVNLENKVIVITGGAGLLGQTFARAIAVKGGKPVIADIRIEAGYKAANQINEELELDCATAIEIDITSKVSLQRAIDNIQSNFGRIDVLVNNAYPRNKNYGRKFENVEYIDFCENVSMHLGGYFITSQQFALYFKKQGYGNIISISSIYGLVAPRFEIYENTKMTMPVEYSVIKSALPHLNKYIMKYFKGSNIRFNCISPGGIFDKQPEEFQKNYGKYSQSKGLLDASDIVGTLLFLASDSSQYINGQNIVVDDGWII